LPLVWDDITALNLTLCVIISILGYRNYRTGRNKASLYIGVGFGLFGMSHLAFLLGYKTTAEDYLLVVRMIGYVTVIVAMYSALMLEQLLKARNVELQKAERFAAIGETAAMVSHDLRNPLQGIASATYMLEKKLGRRKDKETRELLECVEKKIEESSKIIDDLLQYSREIKLELSETNAKSLVEEALSSADVPTQIRVQDLTTDEPRIKVDSVRMRRVILNLISNAVEAMPDGGALTVSSRQVDHDLEIEVADTGIGMTKDIVEKVWTPLFTTKPKGIGLGMATSKRIVEAHGGTISAESIPRQGSRFIVRLPVTPNPEKR